MKSKITAEVDGVRSEYEITFGRYGRNVARGFAVARADAPGGRGGRRREVLRRSKGPYGEGAEGVPHEERRNDDSMRQSASRGLQTLR